MKIEVSVKTNRVGSTVTNIVEIPDGLTLREISEEAWEYACDMIDYEFQILEGEPVGEEVEGDFNEDYFS